jgi:hypothetical protein
MDLDLLRVGRERLSHVFQYLEALNQLRNPAKRQTRDQLWTLWLKDLPAHRSIQRGSPRALAETKTRTADGPNENDGQDFIVRVSRAELTRPPDPPATLKTWLDNGWDDPSKEATVRKTRNDQNSKDDIVLVPFDEDMDRVVGSNRIAHPNLLTVSF